MSKERLDWSDPAAVRRWIANMRVACADADAVTTDLLRPLRLRRLGHIQHESLYQEARDAVSTLLDYADPGPPG
jgi:hypothetical protein